VRWTKAYRALHGKDLTGVRPPPELRARRRSMPHALRWATFSQRLRVICAPFRVSMRGAALTCTGLLHQDTTFEFERRRNRPERYDRNLVGTTLKVRALPLSIVCSSRRARTCGLGR
jgi:hypothetical protein